MAEILTEAKVARFVQDGVPEGKTSATLWAMAPKGLGLRLRQGGAASWIYVYRPKGLGRSANSRHVTLGGRDLLNLKQAEAAAGALAGQVAIGNDPREERREDRARDKAVLAAVLTSFETSLKRRHIVNTRTIGSTLRRGLAPLLTRDVGALTRKDIVSRIDALEAAGKPGAAQDLRRHSRSLLEFAVTRGLVQFNVLAGMRQPRSSRVERLQDARKGRALSDAEIAALWASSASLGSFGALLQLGLLTGLRRSELSGLKWSDIRDDRILIAAERAKTGHQHEVPLTAAMRAVLDAQPRTTSKLVFPGRNNLRLAGWSKLVPRAVRVTGIDFRLHDLRRTCRTLMSRRAVLEEIAELAIGHVRRGLLATYNLDQAWAARVDAFEKVSAHIARHRVQPGSLAVKLD